MDDAQLVQRAATCDKEAFAHVYDRYAGRLHEFLWWVLQDREEADDALYETFVEAGARIHELGDPARLRPWLFAVASRQALRQAPRHRRLDGAEPVVAPESDTSWNDLVQVVRAVGGDLSPLERALLDLKYREGLRDEDLGAAIGADPDAAASLVDRVTERVEATLGDTVVAYLGQKDCPELQAVLGEFDGRLTERQRQVVEQHIDQCHRCGARYRKPLGAPALLRVTPAAAVTPGVTARVLDDVQLATHAGRPWPARRDGFPPPLAAEDHRRWGKALAAVAAMALILGAGALIATRDDGHTEQVSAVGTTVARSASTTSLRATTTTVASTTSSSVADGAGDGTGPGGTTAAPGTTRPAASGGTGSGGGGGGGGVGTDPGGSTGTGTGNSTNNNGSSSTNTGATAPATTTTTAAPDTSGPSLSGLSVSPSTVRAGGGCTNNDPINATVSVNASDPSGVSSVTARYVGIGGGVYSMGPQGGGTYTATIGPFESPVPPGVSVPAGQVLVTAIDSAGNTSQATTPLALRCTA